MLGSMRVRSTGRCVAGIDPLQAQVAVELGLGLVGVLGVEEDQVAQVLEAVEFEQFVEMQGESVVAHPDDLGVGADPHGPAAAVDMQGGGAVGALGRGLGAGDEAAVQADVLGRSGQDLAAGQGAVDGDAGTDPGEFALVHAGV